MLFEYYEGNKTIHRHIGTTTSMDMNMGMGGGGVACATTC